MQSPRDFTLTQEQVEGISRPRDASGPAGEAYAIKKAKGLTTGLDEFVPGADTPWDQKRAAHLCRRINFGQSKSVTDWYLTMQPSEVIEREFIKAKTADKPPVPEWVDAYLPPPGTNQADVVAYFEQNFQWYLDYQQEWTQYMQIAPLREKMTLLWHDHFATEINKYQLAPFAYRHFTMLRDNCLGNFKELVRAIGTDHAMLIYLDGVENRKGSPNENYARELLELFTMGIGHYTQQDITELARALTGYYVSYYTFQTGFHPPLHDDGEKTIFGRTGRFGYDDVIDLIFEEKAQEIAEFICSAIYRHFVYQVPNPEVIARMAEIFIDTGFEIEPVVKALLKSEHFYDPEIMGAMIKSPVDLLLGMYAENGISPNEILGGYQPYFLFIMEQFLFNPPNVAGWPGQRNWISTTTLPYRWLVSEYLLYYQAEDYSVDAINLAAQMTNPDDPHRLAQDLADYLLAVNLPDEDREKLSDVLLGTLPDYEWYLGMPGARGRIIGLLDYIRQLPEYQLM